METKFVNLTPHPINFVGDCACKGETKSCKFCQGSGRRSWVFPPRVFDEQDADNGKCLEADIGKPNPCRVGTVARTTPAVEGMPCVENEWTDIVGLPAPDCRSGGVGTIYIVSLIVLQFIERAGYQAVGRMDYGHPIYDIVCPDTSPTGGAIRDQEGRIVAVTRWVRPRA